MKTRATINLIGTIISFIAMTLLLTADVSFARERGRGYAAPRNTHRERVIVRERARHTPGWAAKRHFFNRRGVYYRPYRSGYYGKRARVFYGRPYGYRRPWPRSSAYISLSGIFYQSPPARYVVVNTPPETIVVRETYSVVQPVESITGNVRVTVSTLNIRTGPGLGYSLVGQVEEGSILQLRGKSDSWSFVRLPDGRSGWAKSVFMELLEPGSG